MTNVFVFLRRTSDKYKTRRQYIITSIRRYNQNVYTATHQYDRTTDILITIRHSTPRRQNNCRRSYLLPKKRTNIKPSSPCHLRRCKNKRHAKSRSFDSILSVSSHDIGQTIIPNRQGVIAATQKNKKRKEAHGRYFYRSCAESRLQHSPHAIGESYLTYRLPLRQTNRCAAQRCIFRGKYQPPRYAFLISSLSASSLPVPLSLTLPDSRTYARSATPSALLAFCSTSRIVVPAACSSLMISKI